jgi:hypothetical protein
MLGGHGRSHAWWSMEDPMFGGQWKIPCLVVMECEGKTPFHLFQFPLTTLL